MNPWKLLEAKLSEAQPESGEKKPGAKPPAKQPLHFGQHEERPELEDVISQYVPELIKAGRNADTIRNILLHFSDEVEAVAGGN